MLPVSRSAVLGGPGAYFSRDYKRSEEALMLMIFVHAHRVGEPNGLSQHGACPILYRLSVRNLAKPPKVSTLRRPPKRFGPGPDKFLVGSAALALAL